MSELRDDIRRGMIQSAYVIERARANTRSRWGLDDDADASRQRADVTGELLDRFGYRRPDEVIEPHTAWFESFVGSTPDEVPLGAAGLHQLGKYATAMALPFLDDDAGDYVELGRRNTRVEAERRPMTDEEALLERVPLPDGRRFVVLTDVHIGSAGRDELARIAVREINEISPEFVVVPGDFTDDGEPEQFAAAKEIFDGLACPYHVVMGNHDIVQRSTGQARGAEFFAKVFGAEPADHVVEIGELQVAVVDTADPTRWPFAETDMAGEQAPRPAGGVDSGALEPGQAAALADRLDRRRPTLVVQHHELHPFPGFPPVKFALREEDAAAELDALRDHRLVGVVAGHTHRTAALQVGDGSVTQLEVPSLKDWPHAYAVAGVGDHGVRVVVRQLGDRDVVLRMARGVLPVMRRFLVGGPWASLDHTFAL